MSQLNDVDRIVQEILSALEAQETPRLSPIVQKCIRLTEMLGDYEHRMLFELHQSGIIKDETLASQVTKWPDGHQPKWDPITEVMLDRKVPVLGTQTMALEDLENHLTLFSSQIPALLSRQDISTADAAKSLEILTEGERHTLSVLRRIKNRISRYVVSVQETLVKEALQRNPANSNVGNLTSADRSSTPEKRRVFIGHGRSLLWRELKDFIQDRLGLECDEFTRVPTAGLGTQERLDHMLSDASFAFLIMTAEDEHSDGTIHARENVTHEVGLFQGRLGFRRAIIMLEENCEEFSNIVGLTQIRFPKNDISARFEEVRRVLEREGII